MIIILSYICIYHIIYVDKANLCLELGHLPRGFGHWWRLSFEKPDKLTCYVPIEIIVFR